MTQTPDGPRPGRPRPDGPQPGRPDPARPDLDGGVPDGFVVVVLAADSPVDRDLDPDRDLRGVLQGSEESGRLLEVLDRLGGPPTSRLLDPAALENARRIDALLREVDPEGAVRTHRSRTRFWRIDLRDGRADPERVAAEIAQLPGVDTAYAEAQVARPPGAPAAAPAVMFAQDYLAPAPTGVGADAAWSRPGGRGAGVRVVDVEEGWRLTHPAIVAKNPSLLPDAARVNRDGIGGFVGDHGTSSVAVVAASGTGVRVLGLAPDITSLDVCSHYDATTDTDMHVSAAIDQAVLAIGAGDVLLVEVQRLAAGGVLPTEIDLADFHAIQDATTLGRIVVEAAGNGFRDVGLWRHPVSSKRDGERRLSNDGSPFDSGAIMVGACWAFDNGVGHGRHADSNFGARVDCFAWGEKVATATATATTADYTTDFSGTSSASAIIAGVVAVTQGLNLAAHGVALGPPRMRELMADPAGTPETRPTGTPPTIGYMPDLGGVAAAVEALPAQR